MSLQTLKRRVEKLEAIRTQKGQHVILVSFGTPEADADADADADRLVEEWRAEAARLGKELHVIRIGWKTVAP